MCDFHISTPLFTGDVNSSQSVKITIASCLLLPHISGCGGKELQKSGRSGRPNKAHCSFAVKCTHLSPDFLPLGIPKNGVVMDGAIQHAPHPVRHSYAIELSFIFSSKVDHANNLPRNIRQL